MTEVETILALLVAVGVLVAVAGRLRVAYPILLVLGGGVLGFVPELPQIQLDPDTVFLIFIPPLVYSAAFFTSWRDLVLNLRPILLLAIGLVLATTLAVAAVAHSVIVGMAWAPAFVLGAVVSNTDTTAIAAITDQVRLPRRVVTILEGESLANDAMALTIFRIAILATVAGAFSFVEFADDFALAVIGAVIIGLAVGWLSATIRRRAANPRLNIITSLLTPYAAFLPTDQLGASGVLAVVIAGLYVGRREPVIEDAATRLQARAAWDVNLFILNGLLFILVGVQLRPIWEALRNYELHEVIIASAAVALTVILARVAWLVIATAIRQWSGRRRVAPLTNVSWREIAVLAWAGMRGGDTLAAALSVPLLTASGSPFPARAEIVFLAFVVIAATLVAQGLTLPTLIRRLGLQEDDTVQREEAAARRAAVDAALGRIDALEHEEGAPSEMVDVLRRQYTHQADLLRVDDGALMEEDAYDAALHEQLRREVLSAQRAALLRLRDEGTISDEVLRLVQRDLDLEEARFAGGEGG